MRLEIALAVVLIGSLAEPARIPAEPLPPVTAFVTRAEGKATAEAPDGRIVELAPGRALPADWRLSLPAGAALGLVCSSERAAFLEGGTPGGGVPVESACREGRPLAPGTYRSVARSDRDLALERSRDVRLRVLQARTRGSEEDDPSIPLLLAPRETAVAEPRPEIRFTRVAGAEEYVLELVGPDRWTERLPAAEVPCRIEERPPGALEVCAVPWPGDAPDLLPATPYFLSVGARTAPVGDARSGEPRRLRLLPAEATGIERSLAALRQLGLPPAAEELRSAVLLADSGLLADAAAAVRRGLLSAPSARGYLVQGSLELETSLPRVALRSFAEAGRLAAADPDLAAEAAAGGRAARSALGEAGAELASDEPAGDPETEAILLRVRELRGLAEQEMESFRPAEALRHVDAALALLEGRGQEVDEAGLLGYRGALLAALQEHEAAESDLEPIFGLLEEEVALRQPSGSLDLTPLVAVLPDLLLSMSSGEWDLGAERLQELGRLYGDRLPESLSTQLELLSLLEEEKPAEAAALCRRLRESEELAPDRAPAGVVANLDMMCTGLDFLAAIPEEGPADPMAVKPLLEAAGEAIGAQPGPFQESLGLLLEQVLKMPDAADRPEAWPAAAELLPSIEALQTAISGAAPPGLRAGLDSLFSPLPLLAVTIRSQAGDAAGSFELAEQVRSRELLDRMADAHVAGAGGGEAEAMASLRSRRDALEGELTEIAWKDPGSPEAAALQRELATVRRELAAARHRLTLERPEGPRAEPLPLREVQDALGDETTLVAFLTFSPIEEDTLAWVVTRDEVRLAALPVQAAELEGDVRRFVASIRRAEEVGVLAEELYRRLWAPLAGWIHTRRVLVIAHGPLQELPFAALRNPDTGRWLAQEATLLHAPSATVWARLARRPAGGPEPPLVLGDPRGDLPAARGEARAVAELWGVRALLGREASEEALRERSVGASLVHVSAHGVLDPTEALLTHLRLAPSGRETGDPRRDGRLELREAMTELDLSRTGLVVLPACHSGEGPRTRGDEVTSLARAFLLAGARSVVTTAWAVDDEATARLMVDFHRRLATGTEAAEALRLAQEAALASADRAEPRHWAGLALHGAGGAVAAPEGR